MYDKQNNSRFNTTVYHMVHVCHIIHQLSLYSGLYTCSPPLIRAVGRVSSMILSLRRSVEARLSRQSLKVVVVLSVAVRLLVGRAVWLRVLVGLTDGLARG